MLKFQTNLHLKPILSHVGSKQIRTLVDGPQVAGNGMIQWNATDDAGYPVSAGLYFYSIQTSKFNKTKKMILLK